MADVKELIPEFFYLPDFLTNDNRFVLGAKQNGEILNDIMLPPWAKGNPREFIRMHREVLSLFFLYLLAMLIRQLSLGFHMTRRN